MRSLLLVVLLVAMSVVAAPRKRKKKAKPPPPPPPTMPQPKVAEEVSERVLTVLESPEHVQAFRVGSSGGLRPHPSKAIGTDFVREQAGAELSAAQLTELKGVLFADKSYRFKANVARCEFVPQVSFQLIQGTDTVEALVSFSCNQVLFFLGKPGNRWLPAGTFDVKPARKKLVALAKETMPGDAPTQSLRF